MRRRSHIMATLAIFSIMALNACASSPTPTQPTTPPKATAAQGQQTTAPAAASPTLAKPAASPATQAPKYGGTITYASATDVNTWDDATVGAGPANWSVTLTHQRLWGGDWTKGAAGGLGANVTDWATTGYDTFKNKVGYIAESWQVNVDNASQQASIIYKLRPGIHFALNPNSPASVKVGGREVNADDVLAAIKQATTDQRAYIYRSNPELRNLDVSKTGPMEITVKVPVGNLVTALSRLGDSLRIYPAEVRDIQADWKNSVGSGPFMLTDYVSGSAVTFKKNTNYWVKDPIGPGKGNQLPYVDGVQILVIPDPSTRLTAFRTAKIDQVESLNWEDAAQLKKESPQMAYADGGYFSYSPIYMRTDKAPFNDIRVRKALMMGTDFNAIKQTINGGNGVIITFPYEYFKDYADAYLGVDDPAMPADAKELYTYNPDKAKQLLAEAGFPGGFQTTLMDIASDSSYAEMLANMWAKIGVNVKINIVDKVAHDRMLDAQQWEGMTAAAAKGPVAVYYTSPMLHGVPSSSINESFINDKTVDDSLEKIRAQASTNEGQAMAQMKELSKYVLGQAYAIPRPSYRSSTFWWPWLKNYSGEISVGYFSSPNWMQFVWIDQDLKKSMGH